MYFQTGSYVCELMIQGDTATEHIIFNYVFNVRG